MRYEFVIDKDKCMGCGNCVVVCPVDALNYADISGGKGAISINGDKMTRFVTSGAALVVNKELCNACGTCVINCPVNAIELRLITFSEKEEIISGGDASHFGEKEQIYELIKKEKGLTIPEIAKIMGMVQRNAFTHVMSLKKEGRLWEGEKREGWFVYIAEQPKAKEDAAVSEVIAIDKERAEKLKVKLEEAISKLGDRKVKMMVERGNVDKALASIRGEGEKNES